MIWKTILRTHLLLWRRSPNSYERMPGRFFRTRDGPAQHSLRFPRLMTDSIVAVAPNGVVDAHLAAAAVVVSHHSGLCLRLVYSSRRLLSHRYDYGISSCHQRHGHSKSCNARYLLRQMAPSQQGKVRARVVEAMEGGYLLIPRSRLQLSAGPYF